MRLRTQLTLFFILMMASILGVGLLTVWGGLRVVEAFSVSLTGVERLSRIRGLQSLLGREREALVVFRRTEDPKELERARSLHEAASQRFKETSLFDLEDPSFVRSLQDRHASLESFFERPAPASVEDTARLLDDLAAAVNEVEASFSERVREDQADLRRLVRRGAQLMFGFIFWQVLLGFIFSLNTLRSLHRALKSLQEGTEAFGQGRFDHRIPEFPDDELGELARSFNRMAENVKDLEVKTIHMHRMSAVGQLAGGVAHEINNPLTGVLGQAQVLIEKLSPDDPLRDHAEKIERAALRCRRIVRSLLDFSRQKETQFASLNIHETIAATLELCEPDFHNHGIQVMKDLSPLVPLTTGNAAQLQQVFLNLAANAVHAMKGGGTLTVSTGLAVFVPPGREGKADGIEVAFRDTGSGIDPDHLPHLFEPFFTTKEIGKGTGLGLSVSMGIVRNHGGDILAESEGKDRGAVFRVFLPLTPPAHLISSSPSSAEGYTGVGPRFQP